MAADILISEKSRVIVSWSALLTLLALVAGAVELRSTVADQGRRLKQIEESASVSNHQQATKADIQRVEDRVMRIESLLLQQRPTPGR